MIKICIGKCIDFNIMTKLTSSIYVGRVYVQVYIVEHEVHCKHWMCSVQATRLQIEI